MINNVNISTLVRFYEMIRKSNNIDEMVDFPSASKYPSKKWNEYIEWTKNNVKIDNLSSEVTLHISIYNKIKGDEIFNYNIDEKYENFGEDSRLCISWMFCFLVKIYKLRYHEIKKIESYEDFKNFLSQNKNTYLLYRGQVNSNYELIPSFYRNLKKNEIFNISKILEIYEKENLIEKYNKIFDKNITSMAKPNEIIDFFTYMQHSISYSPLLDLTDKIEIAAVFANYFYANTNFNDYRNNDSCIICINENFDFNNIDNIESSFINDYCVQIIDKKLNYKSKIFNKYLWELTIEDLETRFLYLNRQTNDRMKYQHGYFLAIFHGVIINGNLLSENNKKNNNRITKYVINKNIKLEICEEIIKNNIQYDYNYLMNPYLFFDVKS